MKPALISDFYQMQLLLEALRRQWKKKVKGACDIESMFQRFRYNQVEGIRYLQHRLIYMISNTASADGQLLKQCILCTSLNVYQGRI